MRKLEEEKLALEDQVAAAKPQSFDDALGTAVGFLITRCKL